MPEFVHEFEAEENGGIVHGHEGRVDQVVLDDDNQNDHEEGILSEVAAYPVPEEDLEQKIHNRECCQGSSQSVCVNFEGPHHEIRTFSLFFKEGGMRVASIVRKPHVLI